MPFLNLDSDSSFEHVFDKNLDLSLVNRITFKITLTSSNDQNDTNAWQKAQLFRQSIEQTSENDHSHYFRINLTILKK